MLKAWVNGAMLATAVRRAKNQPTRLLRYLMVEMFTTDELRCSTVRGKKGHLPALDQEVMNAILCKNNNYICIATVYSYEEHVVANRKVSTHYVLRIM